MSTLKLNSSEEIISFLRILAEESVSNAKTSLSESEKAQDEYEEMISFDEKIYGSLEEQPDLENEEESGTEEEPEEPPAQDDKNAKSTESDDDGSLEVSLDSIKRAVKDLRSGRSVDDSRMEEELRNYFDRLDSMERTALLTFMRSFAGILTGMIPGSDAQEPSDPPYNLNMTSSERTSSSPAAPSATEPDEELSLSPEGEDEDEEQESEPASEPPIKAGEEQRLSEIRSTVKKLMNK